MLGPVACALEKLVFPSLANGFQRGLMEMLGITFEIGKRNHIAVQIIQRHGMRLDLWMRVRQRNSDPVGIVPSQFLRHVPPPAMCRGLYRSESDA